jgi:phosphatidylglycerophosphate synthase
MVSTALILLSGRYGQSVVIPSCIILAREISVSALREWMAQRGLRDVVKVGYQGKLKTAITMASLTLLLLVPNAPRSTGAFVGLLSLSKVLLYLSTILTVTSGCIYLRAALPYLMKT